jgi:SAM-dependent methyltransferase
MKVGALEPYEHALSSKGELSLVADDGTVVALAVSRYLAEADDSDQTVLSRCAAPVLDVGCGPGRMVSALARQGVAVLGVDIADYAVQLAQRRGGVALNRDVFDRVPGEGRWPTILVLDGNIGIGGDVSALLRRLRELISARGVLIIEASANSAAAEQVLQVRFACDGRPTGPEFSWAVVSVEALTDRASECDLAVVDQWSIGERAFLCLSRQAEAPYPANARPAMIA